MRHQRGVMVRLELRRQQGIVVRRDEALAPGNRLGSELAGQGALAQVAIEGANADAEYPGRLGLRGADVHRLEQMGAQIL